MFHSINVSLFLIPGLDLHSDTQDNISVVLLGAASLVSTDPWCGIKILPVPASPLSPPCVQTPAQIPENPLGTVAEVTGGGAVLLHQLPALLTETFLCPRWAHK